MSIHQPFSAGLHHITAISGPAQRNFDFYSRILGLRLVKKTVNFDDPGTYHLYYGDKTGSPGTILTFFPWANAAPGILGSGETGETAFAVAAGSLPRWVSHLANEGIRTREITRMNEKGIAFSDLDGMQLALFESPALEAENAISGFHAATLQVSAARKTMSVLTDVLGWSKIGEEQDGDRTRTRFASPEAGGAMHGRFIDILDMRQVKGRSGAGSVHHIAFRAKSDEEQAVMADRARGLGLYVTEQKDRNYFRAIYFREPSGILFEIATDPPGFAIDEEVEHLGTSLKLPEQYEPMRARIEAQLPPLEG